MRKSLAVLAFSAAVLAGAQANATIMISTLPAGQDAPGLGSGFSVESFDLRPNGAASFFSLPLDATFAATGGASITQGSVTNVSAAPWVGGTGLPPYHSPNFLVNFGTKLTGGAGPDPSKYLTIPGGGTETITFAAGKIGTSFGLYWGSVDSFNQIEFLNAKGVVIATYTGSQILPFLQASGGTTDFSSNGYVEFSGFGPAGFSEVILGNTPGSKQNAFEFDNVAAVVTNMTAAVPEASTWAMMILGFVGVGFTAYRRKGRGLPFRLV
jgi:hypothetical protein